MKAYAIALGVSTKSIYTESKSTHTLANAYFCKKSFCEPQHWEDIIVVASSDHMPRVKYVFKKIFGARYNIEFVISKRAISPLKYTKELLHEIASMRLTKKMLKHIDSGDDVAIRNLVLKKRPKDTISEV